MKRIKCGKCKFAMAKWYYGPGKLEPADYYCDGCIKRGCSCNLDPDTGIEDRDNQGRLLPCCEYNYSTEGFEEEE